MSVANKNLKYLRKLRGLTQDEFAGKLNIKRSLLGAYEEGRAEPRLEVLEAVCDLFKLTLDEILRKDLSQNTDNYLARRRALKLSDTSARIPFVPVKAAAGYLNGYADHEFIDELNTFTLPMVSGGNYRAFEIAGDSMLPTPSGSIIVGEKVEALDHVKNNTACIVVSKNDGIVYKRIQRNGKTRNKLMLLSDNPTFQPYSISSEDVLEMWEAQFIISKTNTMQSWNVGQLVNIVADLQQEVAGMKKKMN
ncbi:XRE family transcriptional regulator [Niabella drilacis]|uniref:DNA-binding transcriptional regulator, XRE-family HTH domain n=1 Tax=Niabella drilacis (strain DSM 25811 / CCM 8410 / CCUG 62505 / LMG 26954 / E90) TaxID=1285928 RepID=A0A1G6VPY8_NIADE|nr:LexA family transcriptional regulator [Niabella drilacis]SDD54886.1 DNA-binding transcriptional regulator, XRE-family HTH domain [Niabella drilacis]